MNAFFLDGSSGRSFCLLHEPSPEAEAKGAVVYLHPFAEEMNKSRRMIGLQASALAQAGWFVLQADLHGCGDSDGDFSDATWERWISDARNTATWLRDRSGFSPSLWGLRAGCLLAAAVAPQLEWVPDMLFWQPVTSGKQHLRQFLRLKLASGILGVSKRSDDGTQKMREQLASGAAIEIGGYLLSSALALGMDVATLEPPPVGCGRLLWFEICGATTLELSPAALLGVRAWEAAGWHVTAEAIAGTSFWQTQEIEELPGLIEATTALLGNAA
ncbi:MAG TPA: hydrolase 2, exosortase A system-associated [Rhodocyclaceae bacterium]|nr:hydrolase 2, exosortase A system-associated [Rhodocyclaceae bacterium]HUY02662.1 hydrolase 2, exosortase A system-associated [Rhodocyclaceae bacterium]